ncbi:MAG: hypothetical protein QOI80_3876 [Solirubrobacteraceae bacterium]|jgi:DNA-binding NarL/FixJ family response regulator|nr:hypothetical protein [Solirubrobacteraceae bacterium]
MTTSSHTTAGTTALRPLELIDAADASIDTLTPRERDVLAHIAGGATNPGIAAELWLSVRTVESHVASIFSKLDLPGTAERRVLAALAYTGASTHGKRHYRT